MSEQMGDIEFQMDIAPYFDYAPNAGIDPSISRYHGVRKLPGDVELTLGGFYVPPENVNQPYTERDLKPRSGNVQGIDISVPVEPGTVNAIHSRATPNVWAHEYRHKADRGMSEDSNRLADAVMAQNEGDWNAAVDMWRDRMRRQGKKVTKSEAERDLISALQFNNDIAARNAFQRNYDLGARDPRAGKPWPLQEESAPYIQNRLENALYKQRALELKNFDKWNEGLPRRNRKRAQ